MCGIIGYNGRKNAIPIVINGLKNLEYRGYDSSGIAYFHDDKVKLIKEKGRILELEKVLEKSYTIEKRAGGYGVLLQLQR